MLDPAGHASKVQCAAACVAPKPANNTPAVLKVSLLLLVAALVVLVVLVVVVLPVLPVLVVAVVLLLLLKLPLPPLTAARRTRPGVRCGSSTASRRGSSTSPSPMARLLSQPPTRAP